MGETERRGPRQVGSISFLDSRPLWSSRAAKGRVQIDVHGSCEAVDLVCPEAEDAEEGEMVDGKNGEEAEAEQKREKASCACDGNDGRRFSCCCGC